jgi:hypothetical protein
MLTPLRRPIVLGFKGDAIAPAPQENFWANWPRNLLGEVPMAIASLALENSRVVNSRVANSRVASRADPSLTAPTFEGEKARAIVQQRRVAPLQNHYCASNPVLQVSLLPIPTMANHHKALALSLDRQDNAKAWGKSLLSVERP